MYPHHTLKSWGMPAEGATGQMRASMGRPVGVKCLVPSQAFAKAVL